MPRPSSYLGGAFFLSRSSVSVTPYTPYLCNWHNPRTTAIIGEARREAQLSRKLLVLATLLGAVVVVSVHAQPMPQTARQALIEMFSAKVPGSFEKHLPAI